MFAAFEAIMWSYMGLEKKNAEKKGLRESRRPILTSSFDEYLFLFGKFLFVLLRKGEIQNSMLEACLDIFLGDVLADIEASLH